MGNSMDSGFSGSSVGSQMKRTTYSLAMSGSLYSKKFTRFVQPMCGSKNTNQVDRNQNITSQLNFMDLKISRFRHTFNVKYMRIMDLNREFCLFVRHLSFKVYFQFAIKNVCYLLHYFVD